MIDIDCHKSGNPESAKAFADWLKDNYFPNLYHEPSTNGKGRHGYFVLFKDGCSDVAVANILKRSGEGSQEAAPGVPGDPS